MNPYKCLHCGGELGHDSDCEFHPSRLPKEPEKQD